jgi:UPF0042 nucleotide-binding protein
MSGAGRSTVLDALEDIGYYCVDNLPPQVIQSVVSTCLEGGVSRIALGLDVRVRDFLDAADGAVQAVQAEGKVELRVLFLDASDEMLVRRFSSTRRPHPLSTFSGATGPMALLAGVSQERQEVASLRALATEVIDTTQLSVHELRRTIGERFGSGTDTQSRMRIRIVSFGFKFGPPVEADLVLDVRFIENPYFVEELRPLTGLDAPVRDFVLKNPDGQGFIDRALELLVFALPRYEKEGKSYLTVAVGCTGGQHRSVAIAEELAARLRKVLSVNLDAVHRDAARSQASVKADLKHSVAPAATERRT